MTLPQVVAGIGVLVTAYGLLKNQTVFSLSGFGIVLCTVLMTPPPGG
jgi:hypothetical protein